MFLPRPVSPRQPVAALNSGKHVVVMPIQQSVQILDIHHLGFPTTTTVLTISAVHHVQPQHQLVQVPVHQIVPAEVPCVLEVDSPALILSAVQPAMQRKTVLEPFRQKQSPLTAPQQTVWLLLVPLL